MKSYVEITDKIKSYNRTLEIEGDKSLSIRWALIASQATGKSKSINLLKSEDVINTLKCLKKLGVKIKLYKNKCEIIGMGCLLYTSPSPRDGLLSRMPSSA